MTKMERVEENRKEGMDGRESRITFFICLVASALDAWRRSPEGLMVESALGVLREIKKKMMIAKENESKEI